MYYAVSSIHLPHIALLPSFSKLDFILNSKAIKLKEHNSYRIHSLLRSQYKENCEITLTVIAWECINYVREELGLVPSI